MANSGRDSPGVPSGVVSLESGPLSRSAPSSSESGKVAPPLADRYELGEELGRGAMGRVHRAFDRLARETIAVKILAYDASAETMERLRRELRAARRIAHPGVVRLHDLMTFEGAPALAMELVEGETLQALLAREGALPIARVVSILRDLTLAVGAAHRAGVVHRDLKPANVILRRESGRAVVTDFGISRITAERIPDVPRPTSSGASLPPGAALTEEGMIVGTPLYMAPEQIGVDEVTGPPADVYALGLLAWEMATGSALDRGLTIFELADERCQPRELSVRAVRGDVPPALAAIVEKCLCYEPARRFADADALRQALDDWMAPPAPAPRRRALLPIAITGGVALAAVVAAAVGASIVGANRPDADRPASSVVGSSASRAAPTPPWTAHIRQLSAREQNLDRPAVAPNAPTIAVPSSRNGHWDIWLFEPERESEREQWRALTDDAEFDAAPQFVDEGRAIAFYSERGGKRGVYRMPIDGKSPPVLCDSAVYVPIGAPRDGARVFYSKDERDVWVYELATRAARRIASLGDEVRIVGIASDERGDRLVLAVQRHPTDAKQSPESTNDLYVMQTSDGSGAFVTSDGKWHGSASFQAGAAPAIVSSSRRGGLLNLWKLALDGGAPEQLASGSGDDIYAVPWHDGRSLLYVHDQTVRQLFVRHPQEKEWRRISHEAIDHQGPFLDPSGKRLYFATFDRDKNARVAWVAEAPGFDPPRPIALPVAPLVVRPIAGDRFVALSEDGDAHPIVAIDAGAKAPRVLLPNATSTSEITVAADGARVAYVDADAGHVVSVDADAGAVASIPAARSLDFSPTRASEIAVVRALAPGRAAIEVRDLASGAVRSLGACPDSTRVAWAGDGRSLWLVPSFEPALRRIDARDGHVLESVRAPGDNALSLSASRDGTLVVEAAVGQSRLFSIDNFGDAP